MIKIKFGKPDQAEAKYLRMVKPEVIKRLLIFKKTLDDIDGPAIRVLHDNIDSYKVTTRELINLVATPPIADSLFNAASYKKTVDDYVADPANQLGNLNLKGLRDFTENLLDQSTKELDGLLTCPADQLYKHNTMLLNKYKLNDLIHIKAIKLNFNYQRWSDVAKPIKEFFRDEEIVEYCPYCNIIGAGYLEDETGEATDIPILDHFFDKASTPLLGYSMYNLVPCDSTCNGPTIKHNTSFNEKYHLNPYERGFDKEMMIFEPVLGNVSQPLKEIYLNIIPLFGSREYRRLIGDYKTITEGSEEGNINLFRHKSRYNDPQILKHCGAVMRQLQVHITNRRSLKGFLDDMKLENNLKNYKLWYYEEFKVEFDEERFHENRYSKLIRDLHDNIVQNSDDVNADLKKFIN